MLLLQKPTPADLMHVSITCPHNPATLLASNPPPPNRYTNKHFYLSLFLMDTTLLSIFLAPGKPDGQPVQSHKTKDPTLFIS